MEDILIKKGLHICEVIDHLFDFDNKFFFDKSYLYCKNLLSLNKDYVNNKIKNFYEECEDYLEELESNLNTRLETEQIKKNFITSFQSNLVSEGKELCKEVESLLDGNVDFKMEKAYNYSNFISYLRDVDQKLYNRCQEYKLNFDKFNKCKENFGNYINPSREEKKRSMDMRLMKLNKNIKF